MNKKIKILLGGMLFSLSLQAQTVEEIQQSDEYLWGTGNAPTLRQADNEALASLISQISTNVSSRYEQVLEGGTENGEVTEKDKFKSIINTYSHSTLTNTQSISVRNSLVYDCSIKDVHRLVLQLGIETNSTKTKGETNTRYGYMPTRGESFVLPPAGIVGVIGPNGAGKTTLFRLIMGLEKPDTGSITVGETVKLAYVDQQHKSIDPDKTVYETVSGGLDFIKLGKRDVNARAYVSRFNFSGADQEKLCGVLSGGERNRLHLALTLKDEGNVLLLDEPTNDVDVNTIRALEEGLESFAGCAVVISHDRWFLDRIATHILAFEGDSQVYFFEGSYSEYEENRKRRLGNEEPKRFKYKKLME